MVPANWYYPQQIYAAKLIKNEQKHMNFPNKKELKIQTICKINKTWRKYMQKYKKFII